MPEKLTQTQIDKAVEYWTAVLSGNRKFKTTSPNDRESPAVMAEMMATIAQESIPSEKISKFGEYLRAELINVAHLWGLDIDYGPCALLADAASRAGIKVSMTTFPWKTSMWFDDDGSVFVREGYGAEARVL